MRRVIDHELAVLEALSPAQLLVRAMADLGQPPPGYGPDLLRLSLAYRLQERGGAALPPSVAREIASALRAGRACQPVVAPLRAGTQLVREWQGETHAVEVTDSGFLYRNRSYRSLSAIARAITGTVWSGPRFFGLTAGRPHDD